MKITVINSAKTNSKPQNYCPWFIDDGAPAKATK
jgi:hypothetical protein